MDELALGKCPIFFLPKRLFRAHPFWKQKLRAPKYPRPDFPFSLDLRVCVPGRVPISSLRPEIGKKIAEEIDFGLTRKIGKKIAKKWGKMARKPIFEPFFLFLGDFFPYFPDEAKTISSAIFSRFRAGGEIGTLPGTHTRNP